jgi:hypothetical protein
LGSSVSDRDWRKFPIALFSEVKVELSQPQRVTHMHDNNQVSLGVIVYTGVDTFSLLYLQNHDYICISIVKLTKDLGLLWIHDWTGNFKQISKMASKSTREQFLMKIVLINSKIMRIWQLECKKLSADRQKPMTATKPISFFKTKIELYKKCTHLDLIHKIKYPISIWQVPYCFILPGTPLYMVLSTYKMSSFLKWSRKGSPESGILIFQRNMFIFFLHSVANL